MIYSIGYATKPIEIFISQLQHYDVDAIADVRSVAYSKVFTDYRRENLTRSLAKAGIKYVYLGDELGPRSKDPAHYDEHGQVQFDRLLESHLFKQGIKRIQRGLENGLGIAMMCAEKDPTNCHRSLLVAHYLKHERGMEVQHIEHDGKLESQSDLERRLVSIQEISADLLTSSEELEEIAYRRHIKQTSYVRPSDNE